MITQRIVVAVGLLGAVACSESSSRRIAEGVAEGVAAEKANRGGDASAREREGRSGFNIGISGRRGDATDARPSFADASDGSVSMHTTNGAFVMVLRHDSVLLGFSDSIRAHVRSEMEAKTGRRATEATGNGRSALGELVQGVVQKTLDATMSEVFDNARGFPVSALRDVSYERGEIRFDFRETPTWTFRNFKSDDVPILEQFHPADAARFVGAVRARMSRR